MNETHVITVGLSFGGDDACPMGCSEIHEVFRGGEAECRQLCARISACSHDRRRLDHSYVTCGPIKEWEAFLHSFR